jgi:hypothetical protein
MPSVVKTHAINQSVFYKLKSKSKLASILNVDRKRIDVIASSSAKRYKYFEVDGRHIQQPHDELEFIHRRLLKLLVRICPPPYLHSAIKRRSYETNALQHASMAGKPCVKIDIKSFYQNVKWYRVYGFFATVMQCSEDVSKILADLIVVNQHLPTGSCLSPLMSYWANAKMFDEINALAVSRDLIMTLYVDDLTFSGDVANEALLSDVNAILHKNGYVGHKKKRYTSNPPLITGLILNAGGELEVPHKRLKGIFEDMEMLKGMADPNVRVRRLRTLVGKLQEVCKFEDAFESLRDRFLLELKALEASL